MTNALTAKNRSELFRHWLAGLDDEQLAIILGNRWDTLYPTPPSIGSLAVRLSLRGSLTEALKHINSLELAVLEVLSRSGGGLEPLDSPEILRRVRQAAKNQGLGTTGLKGLLDRCLEHLQQLALVFPTPQGMLLADDLSAVIPQGLHILPDEPALSPQQARALLDDLDEHARRIVDTLMRSGGNGITKDAALNADPTRPIPQLIARGVLVRVSENQVRLPSQIKDALLGKVAVPLPLLPPSTTALPAEDPGVQEAAAGTGLEMIRLLRSLIERLENQPVALLKDHVVGVRSLNGLAQELGCSKQDVARLVSVGLAADVISVGVPDPLPVVDGLDDYLCPTTLVDDWCAAPLAAQWAWIVHHWLLQATMSTWLVGEPDDKAKPMHLLHLGTFSQALPKARALVLGQLAEGGAAEPEQVRERVGFVAPLQALRLGLNTYEQLLDEAVFVGVVARTASGYYPTQLLSRALESAATGMNEPQEALSELTAQLTPPTTQQLIIQADLTVLAPGPLPRDMQIVMGQATDIESAGVASVYRITADSISRALDSGYSDHELIDFFSTHVVGELPDTVRYLIADTARSHGNLRGGPAMSYLRCEDPALLAQACSSKAAKKVAMRAIAPTVAIAQAPLGKVLEALREEGFRPSAEDATGASIDVRPPAARLKYKQPDAPGEPNNAERIAMAVAALRRAEGTPTAATAATDFRAFFLTAIRRRQSARVEIHSAHGTPSVARITPIAVTGGQVSAVDAATGAPVVLRLDSVTAASII